MENDKLKQEILSLLYQWVTDKKIPQIRGGMVEDLEAFTLSVLAQKELKVSAERMISNKEQGEKSE